MNSLNSSFRSSKCNSSRDKYKVQLDAVSPEDQDFVVNFTNRGSLVGNAIVHHLGFLEQQKVEQLLLNEVKMRVSTIPLGDSQHPTNLSCCAPHSERDRLRRLCWLWRITNMTIASISNNYLISIDSLVTVTVSQLGDMKLAS